MPRGAVGGFLGEGSDADMVGDVRAARALLSRTPSSFRESLTAALPDPGARRP
jgi:hypothetical protein